MNPDVRMLKDYRPGDIAAYIPGQVYGALKNGTKVEKANSEPGDGHKDGDTGIILSSVSHPEVRGGRPIYFVSWDDNPSIPVAVSEGRVKPMSDRSRG